MRLETALMLPASSTSIKKAEGWRKGSTTAKHLHPVQQRMELKLPALYPQDRNRDIRLQ
jgi:hypothetical protein